MDLGTALGFVSIIGLPGSVALTMNATTRGEFRFVRGCFVLTALIATTAVFMWQWTSGQTLWPTRVLLSGLAGAVIFVGLAIALDWVKTRQRASTAPVSVLPGEGGKGGSGTITGNNGIVIGGRGGRGGASGDGHGGDGGSGFVTGDNAIVIGGEGGEAGQADRGGRGGRSPLERLEELG